MGENNTKNKTEIYEVLNHPIRRQILHLIYSNIELSYSDLIKELDILDGTLNFHLKKLEYFLKHSTNGNYMLSSDGQSAIEIMNLIDKKNSSDNNIKKTNSPIQFELFGRRLAAFFLDTLIFLIFTGLFFDPVLQSIIMDLTKHLNALIGVTPLDLNYEHFSMIGVLINRTIEVFSHIIFAVYIMVTLLESYKGQTLGKYVLNIRVVKVSGEKIGLIESGIRNSGKIFLLPLDLIIGIIFLRKKGYLRFFDYYTEVKTEKIIN